MKENALVERTFYILLSLVFLWAYSFHSHRHVLFELFRSIGWLAAASIALNISFHVSMSLLHWPWKKQVMPRLRALVIYWMRLMMRNHRFLGVSGGLLATVHGTYMLVASGQYGTFPTLVTGGFVYLLIGCTVTLGFIRGWSRRAKEPSIFNVAKLWHPRAAYATLFALAIHITTIMTIGRPM